MYNLKYIFLFVEEKLIVYMPNMSLLLLNEIWTNDHLILNTTVYFGIENKYIQIKGKVKLMKYLWYLLFPTSLESDIL